MAHPLIGAAAIWCAVRVVVAGVLVARHGWDPTVVRLGLSWDGGFYREIAERGYPEGAVSGDPPWRPAAKRLAFLPLHPALAALASAVLGLSTAAALLLVSLLAGAVAAALVVAIGRETRPGLPWPVVAVVWACWPGAWALSLGYSEGLFIALCAGSLLALLRGRHTSSAALCALATTTRALGVALVAVVVVTVWARRSAIGRTWGAVAFLATSGGWALIAFSAVTQGRPDAWLAVEREYWGKHVDLGARNVLALLRAMRSPDDHPQVLLVVALLGLLVLGLVVWVRTRPPRPLVWFAVLVFLAPLLSSRTLVSMARFSLPAFPFVYGLADLARRPHGRRLLPLLAVVGVAVLVVMTDLASSRGLPGLGDADDRFTP